MPFQFSLVLCCSTIFIKNLNFGFRQFSQVWLLFVRFMLL